MNPTSRQNNGLWGRQSHPQRSVTFYGAGGAGSAASSTVLTGTQPSRPLPDRHHSQLLSKSSATTSRISPAWVGSSLVSYAVRMVAGPDGWDRCRAGTQPAPCWATTNTSAVHSVSRSPEWTSSPTASRKGGPIRDLVRRPRPHSFHDAILSVVSDNRAVVESRLPIMPRYPTRA